MVTLASGACLRVAEAGAPDGAPVLLLHGWGASLYMWRDWFTPLANAGRHAIAIDLPGHGLSGKPDDDDAYRLESLTSVVRDFVATLDVDRVDVVAQSMAGTIAVELLTSPDSPVRRAVLINPAVFGRVRLERLFPLASASLVDRVLPRLVRRWMVARTHRLQYHDPSTITERDEDEYWAPSQFPAFARAMRRLLHMFRWKRLPVGEMAARLAGSDARILVLLGARDGLVRDAIPYVDALQNAGAGIEWEIVQNGAHAMNEEWPVRMVGRVVKFLD